MEARRIIALVGALLVLDGVLLDTTVMIASDAEVISPMNTSLLVELANSAREGVQAPALRVSALLEQAAALKAQDMATKGYFSHTSPEGATPWSWIRQAGYIYSDAGENLAIQFTDPNDVQAAWMRSSSHRGNILNATYTEVGIATAQGMYQGHPTTYVVQFFGKQKNKTATPAVRATTAVRKVTPKPSPKVTTATAVYTFSFFSAPFYRSAL